MDSVALFNNQGATFLDSGDWELATQCFEAALHVLVSKTSDDHQHQCNQEKSTANMRAVKTTADAAATTKCANSKHGIALNEMDGFCSGNIIQFSGWHANIIAPHSELLAAELYTMNTASEEVESNYISRRALDEYREIIEMHGVTIDKAALRNEILRFDKQRPIPSEHGHPLPEDNTLTLLTLLSAVVVFNMALTEHLAGLSQNASHRFSSASRLYKKTRLLVVSLRPRVTDRVDSHSLSSSAMVDLLYMASWNNEGHMAYSQADYRLARFCFDNLHTTSFYFVTTQLCVESRTKDSTPVVANELRADIYPQEENDHRQSYKHGRLLQLVQRKAYSFLLNAVCYRNTSTAPTA